MTDVQVRAKIAHDAYLPGDTYVVSAERADALRNADLVVWDAPYSTVKGGRRGTRKARQGAADAHDQGSVPQGAGVDGAPGDEPGEGSGAG